MHKVGGQVVLTASDVVNFLDCEHLVALDRQHLETPLEQSEGDEQLALLSRKGSQHETAYLRRLQAAHPDLVLLPKELGRSDALAATREAMVRGASVIYQASLEVPGFAGRADFLRRVPGESRLGAYHYEVLDTKLARNVKAEHVLQLSFYAWLVGEAQGVAAPSMHVVLGNGEERALRYADYSRYMHRVRRRLAGMLEAGVTDTYPHPTPRCEICHWNARCTEQRRRDDHLWQVAGISRQQIVRLNAAGIGTLAALAAADGARHIPRLADATFERLQSQARLQERGRTDGQPIHELRPVEAGSGRGFERLRAPCEGDLFLDLEGDPLIEDGLEYLFGVVYREDGERTFRAFWGHSRDAERTAFEALMDFTAERLERFPAMHVYHYGHYENAAFKRLMSSHGTREELVDRLLREHRLVDLYRVVSEALRASTTGYSLKDIECFYRPARTGSVKTAGSSVVYYERWLETADPTLLEQIEAYNREDCESLAELHAWLLSLRPEGIAFRQAGADGAPADVAVMPQTERTPQQEAREAQRLERESVKARLLERLPARPDATWTERQRLYELLHALIDFHRREQKPVWWKIFSCGDLSLEELIEDVECIGGLKRVSVEPARGRSTLPIWSYAYPEQEFKWREGQRCTRAGSAVEITIVGHDEPARQLRLKPSKKALPGTEDLSLGPPQPIGTDVLAAAVARVAGAILTDDGAYPALQAILTRTLPRCGIRRSGKPLAGPDGGLSEICAVVGALDHSYVFIQGPPGAGKTYTGSRVIVDLLAQKRRVAISSNSHKAVNNLLAAVEEAALERGVTFTGVKKARQGEQETEY
ncbi:MAG: TM0106 family RecB-like putative nuclease, partial [Steroidobacteraceae bacterium]